MRAWEEQLLSGKYHTDQESLDSAEKIGACPHPFSFPTRHLLFAKDYIAMIFTSGQTFVHLTAAGRPEDTDYFYREIVVPYMRNSLHPPLNPAKLHRRKTCTPKKLGGGGGTGTSSGASSGSSSSGTSSARTTAVATSATATSGDVRTAGAPNAPNVASIASTTPAVTATAAAAASAAASIVVSAAEIPPAATAAASPPVAVVGL